MQMSRFNPIFETRRQALMLPRLQAIACSSAYYKKIKNATGHYHFATLGK